MTDTPQDLDPREIARITGIAIDNCERAAVSLEDVAAACERLAAGLRKNCEVAAQDFRGRGSQIADSVNKFAAYVEEQTDIVRSLHATAETVSPSRSPAMRVPDAYGVRHSPIAPAEVDLTPMPRIISGK